MNAIVTGATGFIGSWLTLQLISRGYEVAVVVRDRNKLLPEIGNNSHISVIRGGIEHVDISEFPAQAYDVFFNLAWEGVKNEDKNDVEKQLKNIALSIQSLELAKKLNCRKFVSAGTVAEYALSKGVMDINKRQKPNDIYGAVKVSVYNILSVMAKQLDIGFNWALIPSTYGERRTDNNIITYTIKELLLNNIPVYGDLHQMWDFLYVSDVAKALILIAEKGKDNLIYGIGSGLYQPLENYIRQIRDIINPELKLGIGQREELSKNTFSSCVNNYALIQDTGFSADVSFETGIRKTIEYWKDIMGIAGKHN